MSGGETGIRTLETVSRLHTFQACAFDHSATSPLGVSYANFRTERKAPFAKRDGSENPKAGHEWQMIRHLVLECLTPHIHGPVHRKQAQAAADVIGGVRP